LRAGKKKYHRLKLKTSWQKGLILLVFNKVRDRFFPLWKFSSWQSDQSVLY
jgi:hypothetical protein